MYDKYTLSLLIEYFIFWSTNKELEKTLQELQRVVREKELANDQLNDALRSAQDAKQKAEMDREVQCALVYLYYKCHNAYENE